MAELREIPFEHKLVLGRVASMSHVDHEAFVSYNKTGNAWVTCSCQPEQPWRHHPKQTNEDILRTFNAHLSFATRIKTRVD